MIWRPYIKTAWWAGWTWLATSVLAGAALLGSFFTGDEAFAWLVPGRGTALQFVGGGAFFAAVLPAFATRQRSLISWGALVGAAFVYVGTGIILNEQNPFLLMLIVLLTLYTTLMVGCIAIVANLLREWLP